MKLIIAEKREKENSNTLYRRFLKKFKSSGIQSKLKQGKFSERKKSLFVRKKRCLRKLQLQDAFSKAAKLGIKDSNLARKIK